MYIKLISIGLSPFKLQIKKGFSSQAFFKLRYLLFIFKSNLLKGYFMTTIKLNVDSYPIYRIYIM